MNSRTQERGERRSGGRTEVRDRRSEVRGNRGEQPKRSYGLNGFHGWGGEVEGGNIQYPTFKTGLVSSVIPSLSRDFLD